jgi:hypothetical protein
MGNMVLPGTSRSLEVATVGRMENPRYAHVNSENFRDSINAMPSLAWATHGQKVSAVQKT